MRAALHQPEFLPYLGFIDKMDRVDCFVVWDTAQFVKGNWHNRNRVLTKNGPVWLTVPVSGSKERIMDTAIVYDVPWPAKHLKTIQYAYAKAPGVDQVFAMLLQAYTGGHLSIGSLTIDLIERLRELLGIANPMKLVSDAPRDLLEGCNTTTERIIRILKFYGATTYLSGDVAAEYMAPEFHKFDEAGIKVEFQRFKHPLYQQVSQNGEVFTPQMSVVDLICNKPESALQVVRMARVLR